MKTLLGYLIALPFAVALTAWSAFVLFKLWAWHVVPALHAPSLTYMQTVGLVVVYMALTYSPIKAALADELKGDAALKGMLRTFMAPGVFLLVGWLLS